MRLNDLDQDSATKLKRLGRSGSPHIDFIRKRMVDPDSQLPELQRLIRAAWEELGEDER